MALNPLFIRIVEIKPCLYVFSIRKPTTRLRFFEFFGRIISPATLHHKLIPNLDFWFSGFSSILKTPLRNLFISSIF